jgi:hypothetical protein
MATNFFSLIWCDCSHFYFFFIFLRLKMCHIQKGCYQNGPDSRALLHFGFHLSLVYLNSQFWNISRQKDKKKKNILNSLTLLKRRRCSGRESHRGSCGKAGRAWGYLHCTMHLYLDWWPFCCIWWHLKSHCHHKAVHCSSSNFPCPLGRIGC